MSYKNSERSKLLKDGRTFKLMTANQDKKQGSALVIRDQLEHDLGLSPNEGKTACKPYQGPLWRSCPVSIQTACSQKRGILAGV